MLWTDHALSMSSLIYLSMDWLCVIWFGHWRTCTSIVTPTGYIGCYGVLSPRPNWAKNEQCTCHRKSPNLSGLMCISWYIAQIEEICWLEQSFLLDQCHLPKELKKMQISWIMYNMSKINWDLINSCLLIMKFRSDGILFLNSWMILCFQIFYRFLSIWCH